MGGGDLNLKKSWHPGLMSNQKKVWESENNAIAERKKIDQMMKERAEERNLQELQELQEAAGGKKRQQRVDWMYSGPSSGQVGTTEEMEGYLLGKRRIDGLLKGTENSKLEKSANEDSFMAVQNANTLRDTTAKIREDPMLAIKKQEQAAYEAMMNDPVRRRMLLKAAGHAEPEPDPKRRKHRHHRHHHHHSRRHRHDDEREYRPHDRRYRSNSEDRDVDEREHRRRDRRDRYSSEDRERSGEPRRRRSYSDYSDNDIRSPVGRSRRRSTERRNSYSPASPRPRRRRSRSRSPYRPKTDQNRMRKSKSWHEQRNGNLNKPTAQREQSDSADEADASAKLAAMQQDANDLEEQREHRLKAIAERDRLEHESLQEERTRTAKYGGRATFVDRMHRKAGDISLGDRIGRGGQDRQRLED